MIQTCNICGHKLAPEDTRIWKYSGGYDICKDFRSCQERELAQKEEQPMTEQEFKIGDAVCLRSDAEVAMTVEGTYQSGLIGVVWFDSDSKLHRDTLYPSMLMKP